MASSEVDQLLSGAFHVIINKIEADRLQIAKKWDWKWIFIHQEYFFRKIPVINLSFLPKYLHLQEKKSVISDYEFLLSILNAFNVGTDDYYPKFCNVYDAKELQILYHDCSIILRLGVANHKHWLI